MTRAPARPSQAGDPARPPPTVGLPRWSSGLVFLVVAIGTEAGIANVWKFSYLAGENGGGLFVALYLLALVLIAAPALVGEMLIGRHGAGDPVHALGTLIARYRLSPAWRVFGWLAPVTVFLIMSFYSVVCGWMLRYFVLGLGGLLQIVAARGAGGPEAASRGFQGMDAGAAAGAWHGFLASPGTMLGYSAAILALTALVLAGGVNRGIERVAGILTPVRLGVLLLLLVYSATHADIAQALRFMFHVDWSRLDAAVAVTAAGQAFFSLGIGVGVMLTMGAYMRPEYSIPRAVLTVSLAQALVAIVAGLSIFPWVFSYHLAPTQGPGLLFLTLPVAFGRMQGGAWFGTALFLTLSFAALTATSVILETLVALLIDQTGSSRRRAAWGVCAAVWLAGIPTALSFGPWSEVHPLAWLGLHSTRTPFELIDALTSNVLMPAGGILVALLAGWGLPSAVARRELALSTWIFKLWQMLVRYLVPVAIALMLLALYAPAPAHGAEPELTLLARAYAERLAASPQLASESDSIALRALASKVDARIGSAHVPGS